MRYLLILPILALLAFGCAKKVAETSADVLLEISDSVGEPADVTPAGDVTAPDATPTAE